MTKIKLISLCFSLAAIFAVAFYFRFTLSQSSGVMLDETTVYSLAIQHPTEDLLFMRHWDKAHPPLLYIFVRWAILFFNSSPLSIIATRITFVVFSSLAVYSVFFAARYFLRNSMAALFASLWYAVSAFHIQLGYNMRPYAILQFLLPIAFLAFDKTKLQSKKLIFFWNLLFLFLFYWDYTSVWFFLCYFVYFVFVPLKSIRANFIAALKKFYPFFIGVCLWIPLFVNSFSEALFLERFIRPNLVSTVIAMVFTHIQTNFANRMDPSLFGFILLIFCLILSRINRKKYKNFFLLVFASFFPPITAYIAGFYFSPILLARNQLSAALFMLFLLGFAIRKDFVGFLTGLSITAILLYSLQLNSLKFPEKNIVFPKMEAVEELNTREKVTIYTLEDQSTIEFPLMYAFFSSGYWLLDDHGKLVKNLQYALVDLTAKQDGMPIDSNQQSFFLAKKDDYMSSYKQKILTYCNFSQLELLTQKDSSNYYLSPCFK